jgi:NitT/TauT family transport system permease protein
MRSNWSAPRALREHLPPALTILALVALWEVVSRVRGVATWLLPSPSDIGMATVQWAGLLPQHTLATIYVTLVGFLLSIVAGVILALVVTISPFAMRTIYPLLLGLQSLPKVAIAPLLLMWVGFGPGSKIIVVFLVCFFPIVVSMVSGLTSPPPQLIDLARSFATPLWRIYLKIRIPFAVPYLFIGLKVSITLAVTGAVVGEFVAAKEGLGFLILNGVQQFNTPLAFVAMIILAVLTVVLYGLVALVEMKCVNWQPRSN